MADWLIVERRGSGEWAYGPAGHHGLEREGTLTGYPGDCHTIDEPGCDGYAVTAMLLVRAGPDVDLIVYDYPPVGLEPAATVEERNRARCEAEIGRRSRVMAGDDVRARTAVATA